MLTCCWQAKTQIQCHCLCNTTQIHPPRHTNSKSKCTLEIGDNLDPSNISMEHARLGPLWHLQCQHDARNTIPCRSFPETFFFQRGPRYEEENTPKHIFQSALKRKKMRPVNSEDFPVRKQSTLHIMSANKNTSFSLINDQLHFARASRQQKTSAHS